MKLIKKPVKTIDTIDGDRVSELFSAGNNLKCYTTGLNGGAAFYFVDEHDNVTGSIFTKVTNGCVEFKSRGYREDECE